MLLEIKLDSTNNYSYIYEENYLDSENFALTRGSLRIQTLITNSKYETLCQIVFRNASEKIFISLKCIIIIATILIQFSLKSTVFTRSERT